MINSKDDLERRLDLAADLALRTRERIETAVNAGEVPSWIIDACNVLERASLQYGELAEQLKPASGMGPLEGEMPEPAVMLHSLTVH
ncbi:MAG TPA: hypothetical protein VM240_11940 [Verrucomicrobiae bacterium]|nr:hypothetical protein [Verrucomicrobiae bacterium]